MKKLLMIVVAAVTAMSLQFCAQDTPQDAVAVIDASAAAMGTAALQSVQYSGTGSVNPTGQAFTIWRAVAAVHGHEVRDVGELCRARDATGARAHR